MPDSTESAPNKVVLRRYPNRRYYDAERRQHVSLEAIHRLICDGSEIEVTDSKTEVDITARVLTQIILDHDPLKLALFPVSLLHKIIRSSEPLVKDFVEKWFSQAISAFLESQRQFDERLRGSLALGSPPSATATWPWVLPPWSFPFMHPANSPQAGPQVAASDAADLRKMVEDLRDQVQSLQQELSKR